MATLSWTTEAQRWLEDIFEYIAADNPQAAIETVQGIYDRAQAIATFPEIGFRYRGSSRHSSDTAALAIGASSTALMISVGSSTSR